MHVEDLVHDLPRAVDLQQVEEVVDAAELLRVLDTRESRAWDDPRRAHNAYRYLLLEVVATGLFYVVIGVWVLG